MPTGYTAGIEDGTIENGKDFLLRCARAFGATIHMRDKSLIDEIELVQVDTYHYDEVVKAKMKLRELYALKDKEIENKIDEDYQKTIENNALIYESGELKNKNYNKILDQVLKWIPPTKDHMELKEFAIDQIKKSIYNYHLEYRDKIPKKPSVQEWKETKIESVLDDIEYHSKKHKKEEERCKSSNEWIKTLIESL